MIKTTFIALRRTPYQDSGLIVAGISPDCGRVDLIVKGARSIGPRKFPVHELFRELRLQFREPSGSSALVSPRSAEPLESFDEVARRPEAYLLACEYAAFLLKHSRHMLEARASYESFKLLLRRLACGEPEPESALTMARLAFLQEAGLLPEGGSSGTAALAELLAAAIGEGPVPELSGEQWEEFGRWARELIAYHGLA